MSVSPTVYSALYSDLKEWTAVGDPKERYKNAGCDPRCKCCNYLGHEDLDKQLLSGELNDSSYGAIVGCSKTSVSRHRAHIAKRQAGTGETIWKPKPSDNSRRMAERAWRKLEDAIRSWLSTHEECCSQDIFDRYSAGKHSIATVRWALRQGEQLGVLVSEFRGMGRSGTGAVTVKYYRLNKNR